ncbi:maleylacetate reductase [Aestuariivirga litoralis]|uniref:maleylacetate reductase n=1 Tax=Aestuariivirga litoralis TaxID=2650924 RepID=UPI0018C62C13|nr:maleylacetate reductase [Aestuariivirga litoralis]MBG1233257.1 maleylacetate reductase [Aestuariivirga litoralis]
MIQPFIYQALPTRVIFGRGKQQAVKAGAERLGLKRPLVITGKQQSALGKALAAQNGWPHWDGAKMHTPVDVTDTALAVFKSEGADGVIALGGGSAIGLGKAIALRTDCAQLCLPTTFAGSEMTNILGETAAGTKTTKRDAKIQPETVIYDPDLVGTLPPLMAATSGMNAIAHAVEGLYAVDGNPIIALMAEEGIVALAAALPAGDTEKALYGAWLCGTVLGSVSMALHHKLCHVLGGTFNLPHSETHTVVLPQATAYNASAAPDAMLRIARALNAKSAAAGLFDLAKNLNAPTSLKELGMPEDGLDKAADMAVAAPYPNPKPLERAALRQLLQNAYDGRRPAE